MNTLMLITAVAGVLLPFAHGSLRVVSHLAPVAIPGSSFTKRTVFYEDCFGGSTPNEYTTPALKMSCLSAGLSSSFTGSLACVSALSTSPCQIRVCSIWEKPGVSYTFTVQRPSLSSICNVDFDKAGFTAGNPAINCIC